LRFFVFFTTLSGHAVNDPRILTGIRDDLLDCLYMAEFHKKNSTKQNSTFGWY